MKNQIFHKINGCLLSIAEKKFAQVSINSSRAKRYDKLLKYPFIEFCIFDAHCALRAICSAILSVLQNWDWEGSQIKLMIKTIHSMTVFDI